MTRPRLSALAALLLAGALLALACASDDEPPPRSPVADTATPAATATATPTATPTLPPTVTPTPPSGEPTPPSAQALELFTGNAIELMAEWLGVPATDLAVAEAEALVWPEGCVGLETVLPCGEMPTPGFRVVLLDAFGNPHGIHAHALNDGRAFWRGESSVTGEIAGIDGRAITIAADASELTVLVAPGTRIADAETLLGSEDLRVGDRVFATYDQSPTGDELPLLARLTVIR